MSEPAVTELGGEEGAAAAEQLLTAEQVARRWQVKDTQVYRLGREGQLPCVKLGRYRRWRLADVEAFEAGGGTADE